MGKAEDRMEEELMKQEFAGNPAEVQAELALSEAQQKIEEENDNG
jgi:hypothetical protein